MGQPIDSFDGVGGQTIISCPRPASSAATPDGLRVEVARTLEALRPYEAAWNRLAFQSPQRWPGLAYAWIISHLETVLEPGESWCCVLAIEEDELVGVLPVVIEPYTFLGLDRPRLATPRKWDSFSVDFLVVNGRHQEIVPLLLQALHREYPNLFHLMLSRLPELSPALSLAKSRFRGFAACRALCNLGTYLPITQSFQAYYATLKSNQRKSFVRAKRRLNELPQARTVLLQGQEAGRSEFDKFLDLEGAGWKGKKGSAIKSKPAVARFYAHLTRRLGQLGWLRWYLLLAGDRLLAGQLAVKMNRKLTCVKIAYDETLAPCAPGKVLFGAVLEHAFADGETDEVDCLSAAPYLEDWSVQTRPYYDLWFYPRRLLSLTRGLLAKRVAVGLRPWPAWLPAPPSFRARWRVEE